MSWVTHELLITGQILGGCAYTGASWRIWRRRLDRRTWLLLAVGIVLDVGMAVLGTTSGLGDNPHGTPWGHPLFRLAVVTATFGMVGYMLDLALLSVPAWRRRAVGFLRLSQLAIWPAWVLGVTVFILNVFVGWF